VIPRAHFPVKQTWKDTTQDGDGLVHLVDYEEGFSIFAVLRLRCGWFVRPSSCVWSTHSAPTCPECIEWFKEYLKQPPLPFPNHWDPRTGFEWYDPNKGHPVPEWSSLVLSM
jgi:hypothetical protein